jgi:hypothetical protein
MGVVEPTWEATWRITASVETVDMAVDLSDAGGASDGPWGDVAVRWDINGLRTLAIAAGICSSVLFVVIGLRYELQMYGDGSIFSYSVAVHDAWAFHWHNISGRLFVYLFSYVPAETYVQLTRDARGSIVLYGFLFFVAPLLGLIATFAADRSKGRIIFAYACFSTACLCPLVFGFPTEMWLAHALFWPTLAVCHYTRPGFGGFALIFVGLLALVFTHDAAPIFGIAILATLLLRGLRDTALRKAALAFLVAMLIWAVTRAKFPPDDYYAAVLVRAGLHFFDLTILTGGLVLLLLSALVGYGITFLALRRYTPEKAHVYAALIVAVALATYWMWFDHALHAENRYYLRTVLLIATPVLGALAAAYALNADDRLTFPAPFLPRLMLALAGITTARAIAGAVLLVMLVHAVETAKFVAAWTDYEAAVRALAMGAASDPALGDVRFVSSDRIGANLNRLSWFSTTPFLSVLVAPRFAPSRLVVDQRDPKSNYFWVSCETATANLKADSVVPAESRWLVRVYSCLHRS